MPACFDSSDEKFNDGLITDKSCMLLRKSLENRDIPTVVLTHHHLIKKQFEMPVAQYGDEFREIIRNSNILAVLNGHTHHPYEGVFEGREAVEAVVRDIIVKPLAPGYMLDMQLTTPMIEVAGDGLTARGLWWCPGIGAEVDNRPEPQAVWNWGMVGADFIFENEQWKVWHLHYFRFIMFSNCYIF